MSKRTIIARFEIEDTDEAEKAIHDGLNCRALKSFEVLHDNWHLMDKDPTLRRLYNTQKRTKQQYNNYLNKLKS